MEAYKYTAVNRRGRKVKGEIEAKTTKSARLLLLKKGLKDIKIEEPSILNMDLNEWMVNNGLARPFKVAELAQFTRQLSTLIDAGVPILDCLQMLHKQEKNPMLKKTIKSVTDMVSGGKPLFEALAAQKGFSKLYISLVKAGESGGVLDDVLNKLAVYLEKQEDLRKKVKGALTYPAIVVLVGIGVIIFLMTFIVPQFVGMLQETNQEIPAITQFVINTSDFFQNYTLSMIPVFFIAWTIFNQWKRTRRGKISWDKFVMNLPIFGMIAIKGNLNSFSRTLATLLASGVSILDSIDICIEVVDNEIIARDLGTVRKALAEGKTMSDPLKRFKYFPDLVAQMIQVGEATGNLDDMLLKVSDVFERDTEETIKGMTTLIEPIILVVLGGAVATILVAMYLPIFMAAGGA